jgi:hypothetical protein
MCFQTLCQKEVHYPSLLHFLLKLLEVNPGLFAQFKKTLTSSTFLNKVYRDVYHHTESCRCKLYQRFLQEKVFDREIFTTDLPWHCWNCLAWIARHKHFKRKWSLKMTNGLAQLKMTDAIKHKKHILDIIISLLLVKKEHAARILFHKYTNCLQDEDKSVDFLIEIYADPALIHKVFTSNQQELVPSTWDRDELEKIMRKKVLKHVKKRNWVFKEDLMIKTWHPDRLFPWCLDIEELKDFDSF